MVYPYFTVLLVWLQQPGGSSRYAGTNSNNGTDTDKYSDASQHTAADADEYTGANQHTTADTDEYTNTNLYTNTQAIGNDQYGGGYFAAYQNS